MAKQTTPLKKYRTSLLLLFLLTMFLTLVLQLLLPDRRFSAMENRTLKLAPAFSSAALLDGSFPKNLTGYLEDQFPGRDAFIRLKAGLEKLSLRQENNDVYIHSAKTLIEKFTPDEDELTRQKAAVLNGLAKEHDGARVSVMLVPNKIQILKEELPAFAPVPSQQEYLNKLYAMLSERINRVDLIPTFSQNQEAYLYYRSDHHWTQRAAFLAQKAYLESLGLAPRLESEYEVRKVASDFQGTLASKSGISPGLPDEIDLYVPIVPEDIVVNLLEEQRKLTSFYQMDSLAGADKYLVFLGGNYPVVRVSTSSVKDRRLLLIKDSYANALVPFLTRDFNEITMVDLRYYSGDVNALVEEYLITDILVLYNINTFNDDNSLLNIGDTLSEVPVLPAMTAGSDSQQIVPSAQEALTVSVRLEAHNANQVHVALKNNTLKDIAYSRKISLEMETAQGWVEIPPLPNYTWDAVGRTLGVGAKAEYLLDLSAAFGPLEEGRYRGTQFVDGEAEATALFHFWGSLQ